MTFGGILVKPRTLAWTQSATGPINVCFLIDSLSRAGTETQLLALIRALDRSRVQPHLVLLNGTDSVSQELLPEECPVLCLGLKSILRLSTVSAVAHLRQFWKQHHIDILQTYFLDSTYLGVPLARQCGIKKIVRVRNNLGYWLTGRHRRLGRWMGRLAHCTLTNSEGGKLALMESEGLTNEKVVVLENGVDLDRFPIDSPPDTSRSIVRVGAVANLRPVKNINGLIRAASQLRSEFSQLRFEVAGEGEQRPELERLIAEHRLEGVFQLVGTVSNVPEYLARQDIAVLCSHSEGMSNALLEYMAAGRAIVATDVGANSQLLRDERCGLIVPAREESLLVDAIGKLLRTPQLARSMGAAARRRVEEEFSRSSMVERFEDFYAQIAR